MKMKSKKTYSDRTDIEKLEANWTKTLGLHQREEFSMAIIRATTCAEIAANIAIRAELVEKRHLEGKFVDSLMSWANGLKGKFDRLLMPATEGSDVHAVLRKHKTEALTLNDKRNKIAHSGQFAVHKTAQEMLLLAHSLCTGIAKAYGKNITLKKPIERA